VRPLILFLLCVAVLCGFTAGDSSYQVSSGGFEGEGSRSGSTLLVIQSAAAFSSARIGLLESGFCGNGIIEAGEACDVSLGGLSCSTLGFSSGTLSCDSNCNIVSSACSNPTTPPPPPGGGPVDTGPLLNRTWLVGYDGLWYAVNASLGVEGALTDWYAHNNVTGKVLVNLITGNESVFVYVGENGVFSEVIPPTTQDILGNPLTPLLTAFGVLVAFSSIILDRKRSREKKRRMQSDVEETARRVRAAQDEADQEPSNNKI